MTEQELNRAVQYVTAATSHGRDTVAEVLRIGFTELASLATSVSRIHDRGVLLEYVCQWTIRKTGHPEHLIREILGCAGRWLDEMYEQIAKEQPELLRHPEES